MPRIEEVQFVHWGSLRPDPVPLLTDGINVATGPNGSGKTCFLDGLKLVLGVTDFTGGRTPAKYIFDGGGATPADKAYLRATFVNPVGASGRHRVFAWAGQGCESAEHVTIACVVTGQERWYVALPGRVSWGTEGASLSDDLAKVEALPRSRRMGPRQFDQLLERAGVTKALRGVLALPQGATDRLVEERPTGMLLRLLELTGKQHTREEFRAQREEYLKAKEAHAHTLERYRGEQRHLELLQQKARRHEEWCAKRDELRLHQDVLLPAARHRDLTTTHAQLQTEVDQRAKAVEDDEAEIARLAHDLPETRSELARLTDSENELDRSLAAVRDRRSEVDRRVGGLLHADQAAKERFNEATRLAGDLTESTATSALESAESAVRETQRGYEESSARLAIVEQDIALLVAGQPVPPRELATFVATLAGRGIPGEVVAEHVDLVKGATEADAVAGEAALGDALWAVVVPVESFDAAVQAAVDTGHRWPIAAEGEGRPTQALAAIEDPGGLGALLEELDLPVANDNDGGDAVVTADGVRRTRVLARLQAPANPVLGRGARERHLETLREEAATLHEQVSELSATLPGQREMRREADGRLQAVRDVPGLVAKLEALTADLAAARSELEPLVDEEIRLNGRLRATAERRGSLGRELTSKEARQGELERRLGARQDQLRQSRQRLAGMEEQLATVQLTDAQRRALDLGRVLATEVVERDAERLAGEVRDTDSFPDDVRDELIVHQRDEQARIVDQVNDLVLGRADELESQQKLVDEAARRYDEHIRAVVRLLNQEFARVCQAAGADGEIRIVAGDRPDEQGVEVRVAHRAGEARRSYRDPAHSGGQRAKTAILILLAAMAVGGEADLLIMDEHIAHLDSTNIDHIAELMHSLRDRVQFVLATPTNAEALRLGWCDLQLAFLPRSPGEAYTPPVRIMSAAHAEDLEQRFAAAQLTL